MINLTNRQARQFLLLKHGLIGEYKFIGKQGVYDFVRQAGCIQYDPIDICGKNAELTLQSRVKSFTKEILDELLYKDRLLIDYPDKNTAIIRTDDWPYFMRHRQAALCRARKHPELITLMEQALTFITVNGVVSPDDLKLESDFQWRAFIVWSSGKNLSSSVMEQLYGIGDLIIHHKKGSRKYYDVTKKYIPAQILGAPDPLPDEFEYRKWRVLRRIGAIGLLGNRRPPDSLHIGFSSDERNKIFTTLLSEGKIIEISVDESKYTYYCLSEDISFIHTVKQNLEQKARCELIAPLDPFLWDRKLIKDLFGFDYTWEIYTPVKKRKYGHYVLPLLWDNRFIGRVEAVAYHKISTLVVKNIWYEDDVKQNKAMKTAITRCILRFAEFNGCDKIHFTTSDNLKL